MRVLDLVVGDGLVVDGSGGRGLALGYPSDLALVERARAEP